MSGRDPYEEWMLERWGREAAVEDRDEPRPVCGFCKDGPVGDAATWLDGKPRPPAPCPRCGKTYARASSAQSAEARSPKDSGAAAGDGQP